MSVSLLNALMSQAPQVAQLPDKHLCIDLLCCHGLITGEGGQRMKEKRKKKLLGEQNKLPTDFIVIQFNVNR